MLFYLIIFDTHLLTSIRLTFIRNCTKLSMRTAYKKVIFTIGIRIKKLA